MVVKTKTKEECLRLRKDDVDRFGPSEALQWIPDQLFDQYLNVVPFSKDDDKDCVLVYTPSGRYTFFIPRDFIEEELTGTRYQYVKSKDYYLDRNGQVIKDGDKVMYLNSPSLGVAHYFVDAFGYQQDLCLYFYNNGVFESFCSLSRIDPFDLEVVCNEN